jgi:hypothetical protein
LPDESRFADEQQLARYLLGLVSEQEAERLDEATIVDDEMAARLRIAENDLVDGYVSGMLSNEMVERFETRYLASPRRRAEATFAGSFLGAVDRAGRPDPARGDAAVEVSAHDADTAATPAAPASKILAAAAVLFVACGSLLYEAAHLRNGMRAAENASISSNQRARDLERQLTEQRAANAELSKAVARSRESAAAVQSTDRTSPETRTAALVLLPQTRAVGPIPMLAIPAGTSRVAFGLRLESNDYPRYRVVLTDPSSNRAIWRSGALAATSQGDAATVSVAVPGRVLKPQHYALAVMAEPAAPNATVVGSYAFQVARR